MADHSGTLEKAARAIGDAFVPFAEILADSDPQLFLIELGLDAPPDLSGDAAFVEQLAEAVLAIAALPSAIEDLAKGIEDEKTEEISQAAIALLGLVKKLITAVEAVAADLVRAGKSAPNATDIATFAGQMVERLLESAVIRYLERELPTFCAVLRLLTIVEATPFFLSATDPSAFVLRRRLHLERIAALIQNPITAIQAAYGWGTRDFKAKDFLERVNQVLYEIGVLGALDDQAPDDLDILDPDPAYGTSTTEIPEIPTSPDVLLGLWTLEITPTLDVDPPGLMVSVVADVVEAAEIPIAQLADEWRMVLALKGSLAAGAGIVARPPAHLELVPGVANFQGETWLRLIGEPKPSETSLLLFGMADASRLQVARLTAGIGAELAWNAGKVTGSGGFEVKFEAGKLVIEPSKSDGFLQKILPSDGIVFNFDFDLGWSSDRGFFFSGSAGLELALALNKTLGPFHLDTLHLLLGIAAAGIEVEASLDGGATLGPVACSVQRLGVALDLKFQRGNLGPVQLDVAFKPPNGLGLVIDAGPVTGGGFISFDPANGRYAGVLQLKLYEIGITAIGLLDTRLPGGKPGFSFLIIIAVEFTPIQLGFGFTLNGVGGLAGINRTMVAEELRQGVRQHSLENILFPQNPIARATQLISDLGRIFPPAEGRYVFGPMVKLGWGTFVEAELGIIIELPSPVRIAILGEVDAYFPLKDEAIIEIHLDVLGIIDFGAQLFSLDASLHDSRVLLFGLSGDMAMRLSWGDDPSFAFSIGGLNPHFQPPPGFPTLRRLTLTLGDGDNPRLSLEGYFALTSNSFQFGAALSLYASLGALEVKGFLGFDALFIFSPFSFIIDFEADLDVTLGSLHLVGIHIHASLSGPTPWHIAGELSISLLFFDISVHVDFILGDERHDTLPEVDTWTPLQQAIMAQTSWEGVRPPLALQAVKLSAPEGSGAPVLVDPVGGASLREKILPLGQTISRFAEVNIAPVRYELDSIALGDDTITPPAVQDHFAPGAFRPMTDAEKISSPSFVWMQAGFTIASDKVALGGATTLGVQYTTRIIDAPDQRRDGQVYPMPPAALLAAARVAAAGTGLGAAGTARFAPDPRAEPRAAMNDEAFVVAGKDDLQPRLAITPPTSKGLAQAALAQHLAANPGDRDRLQVIPAADAAA